MTAPSPSLLPSPDPARTDPSADPIEHLIAWHDGDTRAALRTLLDDCRDLRERLAIAEAAMGRGYTRGWKPSLGLDSEPIADPLALS